MEFFRQLIEGITHAWRRLSISARTNIILAAAASILVIALLVFTFSQPQFVQLYTRLDLDESAQIQSILEQENISYRVEDGGQTVLVPVQQRSQARVTLAAQNLPKSQGFVPGFELLDQQDLLTNQYMQNVNYMRALQGELQRQLNQFEFIDRSFVFIREEVEALFLDEQKPSQAAVTLAVNRPLRETEVKAVLGVVSSFGGANLHRGNIHVSTTEGTILYSPPGDEFAALAGDRLQYKQDVERLAEEKVRRAFSMIGKRVVVSVSADVDWTEERITKNEASKGATVSSLETETTTTTTEGLPQGAPGAVANIPDEAGEAEQIQTQSETTELLENFQPSTTMTEMSRPGGRPMSYRVAAFVEGEYVEVTDEEGNPTGEQQYQPLTAEQLTEYQSMIAAAVGVNVPEENISVTDHPFEIDGLDAAQATVAQIEAAETRDTLVKWGIAVGQVVLVVAGFIVVRLLLRRAMVLPRAEEEEAVELAERSPEDMRRQEVASEVERLSREEPETVAALLRSWMAADEE